MNPSNLCDSIGETMSHLFECSPAPKQSIRIRTPLTYPDGGIVDVFLVEHDGQRRVTDFGEALGWLRMQSVSGRRFPKQNQMIEDACQTQGVKVYRGQLVTPLEAGDDIGDAVLRLAQAAARVSDLWFTFRARPLETTSKAVNRWLSEKKIPFERSVQQRGRSGRNWTIDYRTHSSSRTSLILLLSPSSRGAAQRLTEHVLAGWVDLEPMKHSRPVQQFISLFDDTEIKWQRKDFGLLEPYSRIAHWSRRDEFEKMLSAA